MGIPSIFLHNLVNGHAVNLTLNQPIDREITVFFPMIPGKDVITLVSDELLDLKITNEVTRQVNTVVMQKVEDEINNQFTTTIMPKIEQSIINYDQNVTARFDVVNQFIQNINNDILTINTQSLPDITLKLDQEKLERKEEDRKLKDSLDNEVTTRSNETRNINNHIKSILNVFDRNPNDGVDATVTDLRWVIENLVRIAKDTSNVLETNPTYDNIPTRFSNYTTNFLAGNVNLWSALSLNIDGTQNNKNDPELLSRYILNKTENPSKELHGRNTTVGNLLLNLQEQIKMLGLGLSRIIPIGTVIPVPTDGTNIPGLIKNYLRCDGSEVSATLYENLKRVLNASVSNGKFRLPNLQNQMLRFDPNKLGQFESWKIPNFYGKFEAIAQNPATGGIMRSREVGGNAANAGQNRRHYAYDFSLSNEGSYNNHIGSTLYPDYYGVEFWIKF